VSLQLAQELSIPVFMVPPDAEDRPLERVLVALEGDGERESLLAVARQLDPGGPDVVAVHVFPPLELPAFSDHPVHETEAWAREFVRRAQGTPYAELELELRVGDPALEVSKAVRDLDVDMVALVWHRDASFGHARLVRRVLETSHVPVLLLPTARAVVNGHRHHVVTPGLRD
jgi:nucleotide-binding universal stress UspA family protein